MARTKTRAKTKSKAKTRSRAKKKSNAKTSKVRKTNRAGLRAAKKDDPKKTLILAADDGKFYELTESQWQTAGNVLRDPGQTGVVKRLRDLGTLVASLPLDFSAGEGLECILVNVEAIASE